jgi:hypothetical protein
MAHESFVVFNDHIKTGLALIEGQNLLLEVLVLQLLSVAKPVAPECER